MMIDQELEMKVPLLRVLHLIQQQDGGLAIRPDLAVVLRQDPLDRQELQHRMVEAQIEDGGGFLSTSQEPFGELIEDGRLPHSARTGKQDPPADGGIEEVAAARVEREAVERGDGDRLLGPPGIDPVKYPENI